jgi:hypothetical protein
VRWFARRDRRGRRVLLVLLEKMARIRMSRERIASGRVRDGLGLGCFGGAPEGFINIWLLLLLSGFWKVLVDCPALLRCKLTSFWPKCGA